MKIVKYKKTTGALKKLIKKILYYLENNRVHGLPSAASNPENFNKAMERVRNVRKIVR